MPKRKYLKTERAKLVLFRNTITFNHNFLYKIWEVTIYLGLLDVRLILEILFKNCFQRF